MKSLLGFNKIIPSRLNPPGDTLPNFLRARMLHMGGCKNYGPFFDPYYNTAPNIFRVPKKGP